MIVLEGGVVAVNDGDGGDCTAEADDGAGEEGRGRIGIFKQDGSISMLGPGTSEQRINEVTMPNIGRPLK